MSHTIRDQEKLLNRVRRIRGQLNAVEKALEQQAECEDLLQRVAACRGGLDSLMFELIDGHVRFHILDPDRAPTTAKSKSTRQLLDVLRTYLR